MPGIMSWEEMDWMFPDYEDTGLVYHSTKIDNLVGVFSSGLIPGNDNSEYGTIYDSLYRYRPDHVPNWVDPRKCVFCWMNMKRFRYRASGSVVLGIRMDPKIVQRTWIGIITFSNWIYGPKEAGYFDTEELSDYYRNIVEPVCAEAYWKMTYEEPVVTSHESSACQRTGRRCVWNSPDYIGSYRTSARTSTSSWQTT